MMWIEKYRPETFQDTIGMPTAISNMINNENELPHLLFCGNPGTGKTTTARIIIKKLGLEHIELNASDERGIQTIRDKVKSFAMTASMNGKIKIIFLDEMDSLTKDAQPSLRNIMEKYHSNCRFIGTANYENRIIDALQSRFTKFNFKQPDKKDILKRLNYIVLTENIKVEKDALTKIIETYYPDIRKMINKLQELNNLNKDIIKSDDVNIHDKIIPKLWDYIQSSDFLKARQLCLDSSLDYWGLLDQFRNFIMNNDEIKPILITKLYHQMRRCLYELHFSAIPDITFEDFILCCMEECSAFKKKQNQIY